MVIARFIHSQFQLSLRAGFSRRKALSRALRAYRFGF